MAQLQAFARKHLVVILLLLLAGGFAITLWELVIYQHWEGTQRIGLIATIAGLVLALAGMFVAGTLRNIVAVLLILLSVTGLIGTYQHFESNNEEREGARPALITAAQPAGYQTVAYRADAQAAPAQEGDEAGEGGEAGESGGEMPPPPLAPLSICGLSLMAAVVVLAKQDKNAAVAPAR